MHANEPKMAKKWEKKKKMKKETKVKSLIKKMVGEYNKAKTEMQNQIKDMTETEVENVPVNGPVQTERQKLEKMAHTLRIQIENKSDDELKQEINFRFGQIDNNSETKFKN